MPNVSGRNIYLIRQDINHLDGEYFDCAVVIAAGPGRAVKGLLRHVRTHHPAAIARRGRLTVVRIGGNAPARIEPQQAVNAGDEATIVTILLGKVRPAELSSDIRDDFGNALPHPTPIARSKEMNQKPYQVAWEIDLNAATPEEAARQALAILRDPAPGSLAHVFLVTDEAGNSWTVDLDA